MTDYTLIVHTNAELTKWDEYAHVDVHGIKNGCLYIHFKNKTEPYIIPLHAFYLVSVLEK
jgi:hypothetical protein